MTSHPPLPSLPHGVRAVCAHWGQVPVKRPPGVLAVVGMGWQVTSCLADGGTGSLCALGLRGGTSSLRCGLGGAGRRGDALLLLLYCS